MRYTHEEIREMLPDYLNGCLEKEVADELRTHLDGCEQCREEVSIISGLKSMVEVPDPGDLFWNTLPQRVSRLTARGRRGRGPWEWLLRPVPVMVSLLLISTLIFSYLLVRTENTAVVDPLFEDPLAYSTVDVTGITEGEILYLLAEEMGDEDLEIYVEAYDPFSYHMDIASLGSTELEGLFEALQEQTEGGERHEKIHDDSHACIPHDRGLCHVRAYSA